MDRSASRARFPNPAPAKKLGFSDRQLAIADERLDPKFAGNASGGLGSQLSTGRYLRGGVRSLHALLLFHLRRGDDEIRADRATRR